MKNVLSIFLLSVCVLFISFQTQAQRVLAYYPYYVVGEEADVQYDKLTDIVYAFLQLNANGTLGSGNYFNTSQFAQIRDLAHLQGTNVHVSVGGGGAPSSDLAFVSSNVTNRGNMVADIVDFVAGNHALNNVPIKGIDVDWEFPTNQTARDNHEALLSELRTALDAQGIIDDTHYELSIAVGADVISPTGHDDYINPGAFQYPDLVSVMAYDLAYVSKYGGHHSNYEAMVDATTRFNAMGCPYSKMNVGVPFYGRTSGGSPKDYNLINSSGSASIMQQDAITVSNVTHYYNGTDLIEQKADYMIGTLGGQGITIWELTQDRTDEFSLLAAAYDYIDATYGCNAPQPDLGDDVSLCGSGSASLNSNVQAAMGRTFSWERDGTPISGTGPTLTATVDGTYTVKVHEDGCFKSDDVEVSGTLPTVDLGGPYDLCNPSIINLDAGISGNGINYLWEKDGLVISGETNQSLDVGEAGVFDVTVSAAGCSSQSGTTTVTSSLINAEGDSRCFAGEVTLNVLDNNGPYEWFDTPIDGTSLHEGDAFTTTISNSTTFYVHTTGIQQNIVTGATNFNPNWSKPIAAGDHHPFTVLEDLTFNSINVQSQNFGAAGEANVKLYDASGTTLLTESGTTPVPLGTEVAIPLDYNLSPGDYRLVLEGARISIGSGNANYPVTEPDVITINFFVASSPGTASDSYFFKWDLTTLTGSPCERTPVEAIVDICTGQEAITPTQLSISPNPAQDLVHISGISNFENSHLALLGVDGLSYDIDIIHISKDLLELNLNDLNPGVYLIQVSSPEGTFTERIIKRN